MTWCRSFGLILIVLLSACSAAPQLPSAVVDQALCALSVQQALPTDPMLVTAEDGANAVREFKACMTKPDGGAL